METRFKIGTFWADEYETKYRIIAHIGGVCPIVAVRLKDDGADGHVMCFSPAGEEASGKASMFDLVKQIIPLQEVWMYVHKDTNQIQMCAPLDGWEGCYRFALFREVRDESAGV